MRLSNNIYMYVFLLVVILLVFIYRTKYLLKESFSNGSCGDRQNLIGQCNAANNNESLCDNAYSIKNVGGSDGFVKCKFRPSDRSCIISNESCEKEPMPFVSLNPSNNVANNVQSGHKNDVICSPNDGKTRGGLRAFQIGAAGPANNDGKQIMGWSRERIANACKDFAKGQYGNNGYSSITVHSTGPWFTRGCAIHHGQSNKVNTSHYPGKACYFNSKYTGNSTFGCTDFTADNFNNKANVDDGSCVIKGCTISSPIRATNYNSRANVDDGSCIIKGCTNPLASNYKISANTEDGSCLVGGCTDPNAKNRNLNANYDDGSCEYIKYGCMQQGAENYDQSAEKSDGSCSWPNPPPSNYYSTGSCGIQYDSGICVKDDGQPQQLGIHKLDNIDKGTSDVTRNLDCYKKAKIEHGENLKGVQILSKNEGASESGCYAYTNDVFKGSSSEAKGEICHIIGKHSMTCQMDIKPEECDSILERKKMLNLQLENINKQIESSNNDLQNIVENNTNELKNRYGVTTLSNFENNEQIIVTEQQKELKGRLDLIELSHEGIENDSDIPNPYLTNCTNEVSLKLIDESNKELALKKDNERLRFSTELMKRKIARIKLMNLRSDSELKETEHNLQLAEQERANKAEREALENELKAREEAERVRALKVKQEQEAAYLEMKLQKQQEIAKLNDEKMAKEYEHQLKTIELAEARAKALEQAKELAETKEQINALDEALKDEQKKIEELKSYMNKLRNKQIAERAELQLKIDQMILDLEECNETLKNTIALLTEVEKNVAECSLFVRQMQRLQPTLI